MRRVFVRFMGESLARKKRFKIIWPLDSIQFIQRQIGLNQGWCHLLLCVMSTPQKINNRFQIELESKYGRLDVFDRANNKKGFLLQTFCNNIKKGTKFEKTYLILFWSLTTTDVKKNVWHFCELCIHFRKLYDKNIQISTHDEIKKRVVF